MKAIGLVGGMSWVSTAEYYRQINVEVRQRFGGLHSANLLMHSCNFDDVVVLQKAGQWGELTEMLVDASRILEGAGAGCIAICTNTMHNVADQVQESINIPLIDIRKSTASAIYAEDVRRVGLIGTKYTMEKSFYRNYFRDNWDIDILTPSEYDRQEVHKIIFDELCQGNISINSRRRLILMIEELERAGAEGVILGCTELMFLIDQECSPLPVYDTTTIHSRALVRYAIDGMPPPRPPRLAMERAS